MLRSTSILGFPSVELEPSNDTDQLKVKIDRYLDLKEYVREYNSLKHDLKEFFEGIPEIFVGDYKVTGRYIDMPPKEIPSYTYWDMRFKKI